MEIREIGPFRMYVSNEIEAWTEWDEKVRKEAAVLGKWAMQILEIKEVK